MWLSEVLSDTHTLNGLYLKDSFFKLHFLKSFLYRLWTFRADWSFCMDRASGKKTEGRSCHSSHFLPLQLLCSRHPSWRSGPRTWSSEPNTSWTSPLWPVTQSNHTHTHSIHRCVISSFLPLCILAYIIDFCEDTAIAPGFKRYIHVVEASYLIELACNHLKIIHWIWM